MDGDGQIGRLRGTGAAVSTRYEDGEAAFEARTTAQGIIHRDLDGPANILLPTRLVRHLDRFRPGLMPRLNLRFISPARERLWNAGVTLAPEQRRKGYGAG